MIKTVTKNEWVSGIMRVMNELGWDDDYSTAFIGADTTHVEENAGAIFVDAWRKCLSLLPKSYFLVTDATDKISLFHEVAEGTGYFLVPSDFIRLSEFKIRGWKKSVYEHTEATDEVMTIQSNKYVRGSSYRPVLVINDGVDGSTDERRAYYFSTPLGIDNPVVEVFKYIAYTDDVQNGNVDIDERLYIPMTYIGASLIYTLFEKYDIAAQLEEKALNIAGIQTINKK